MHATSSKLLGRMLISERSIDISTLFSFLRLSPYHDPADLTAADLTEIAVRLGAFARPTLINRAHG